MMTDVPCHWVLMMVTDSEGTKPKTMEFAVMSSSRAMVWSIAISGDAVGCWNRRGRRDDQLDQHPVRGEGECMGES